MWLHPPFFSIDVWHFGHAFVLATSQLYVSESSRHLTVHAERSVHEAGAWSSCKQLKQKRCEHEHLTEKPRFDPAATAADAARLCTALAQSGAGHHLSEGWSSTKERARLAAFSYRRSLSASVTSERTSAGVTTIEHLGSGQRAK